MGHENALRISWLHFIPVIGYFLYLPQSRLDFPDLSGKTKLFMVLENTLLYFSLGFLGHLSGIPPSSWFTITILIVCVLTPMEFYFIKKWGDKFRALGWHRVQSFKRKKLLTAVLFVGIHTWGFLSIGYLTSLLIMQQAFVRNIY